MTLILVSNYISVLCTTILIFVHWKKGSKWYVSISPYIFFTLLMIVYFVVPVTNIIFTIFCWIYPVNVVTNLYETWVVFYFVLNFARIFSFFTEIRFDFLAEANM